MPALMAASSASVGRINLCFITTDLADDPKRVAAIDKHDAIEALPDRSVTDLRRLAVIHPRIGFGQDAVPLEPCRLTQRNAVFRAINRVFRRVVRDFHLGLVYLQKT